MQPDKGPSGEGPDRVATPEADPAHGVVLTELLSHMLRRAHFEAEALFAPSYPGLNVTSRQLAILFTIARYPGASQSFIADQVGLDANTFSDLADRSHRKGLIRKHRLDSDRRSVGLHLTELGSQTIAAAAPLTVAYQARLAKNLSPEEAAQLVQLLRRFLGFTGRVGSSQ